MLIIVEEKSNLPLQEESEGPCGAILSDPWQRISARSYNRWIPIPHLEQYRVQQVREPPHAKALLCISFTCY